MTTQGQLKGIAIRASSRAPLVELPRGEITTDAGVVGDFRGQPGERQVTVLAVEDWRAACQIIDKQLPWTTRRANLLIEGVPLRETTGSRLRIGEVILQITGETDPCSRMEELASGLRAALDPGWRGGVCCRVIRGGELAPGATVTLESDE